MRASVSRYGAPTDDVAQSIVTIFLILVPHPSLLIMLVRHHLQTLRAPVSFVIHVFITYTLTFLVFSSLIVCVSRDPGQVPTDEVCTDDPSEEIGLRHALMSREDDDEDDGPGRWCFTCQAPKPERTRSSHSSESIHYKSAGLTNPPVDHCSQCGRCVLKMGA